MLVFDAPDRAVSRTMQHFICDGFRNGAIGHQLYRRFKDAWLVAVEAHLLGRAMTDFAHVESAFDLRVAARRAADVGVLTRRKPPTGSAISKRQIGTVASSAPLGASWSVAASRDERDDRRIHGALGEARHNRLNRCDTWR